MKSEKTETENRQGTDKRHLKAIELARLGAVRNWLERLGSQRLDGDAYRIFRAYGCSRQDLDRCIDLMAEAGEVIVETSNFGVSVRLVEGPGR